MLIYIEYFVNKNTKFPIDAKISRSNKKMYIFRGK